MFLRLDVYNHSWTSQAKLHLFSLVSALFPLETIVVRRATKTMTLTLTGAGGRSQDRQEDWQRNETMEQAKHADEEEDLEE